MDNHTMKAVLLCPLLRSLVVMLFSITLASAENFAEIKARAEKGDIEAQKKMGLMYMTEDGVAQDLDQAAKWYRMAAEKGDASAQMVLSSFYENGHGVLKDQATALMWLMKAVNQGYAPAQFSVGSNYYFGVGVPKNLAQAAIWWGKAADQGDFRAWKFLAAMLAKGEGVKKDVVRAYMYYNLGSIKSPDSGKDRDELAKAMTPEQIAQAQRLSREWKPTGQTKR